MFLNFIIYFLGIVLFKFYVILVFNYESVFDLKQPLHDNYDYIIGKSMRLNTSSDDIKFHLFTVGSGSAGAVVASHLKGKVLVIEAGSKGSSFFFNIPIIQPLLQLSPYDWNFKTSPQTNSCHGLKNNQSSWPAGKIAGGSHRLNNMVYHRGHPADYEHFITQKEAEKFFQENEKNVPVNEENFQSPVAIAFIEAGQELGFDDFNYTKLTQQKGRRYTQIDHLKTLTDRPEIIFNAKVTRVLFDIINPKKAIGVEFVKYGKLRQVIGNKIVLSAGAIGSPKILLHSGIGPKNHLENVGIEVRENLPVGENLNDHITTGLDLIILNRTIGLSPNNLINPFKIFDYFWYQGKESPLALAGSDAMGFVNLRKSETPDLSFMLIPVGLGSDYGIHFRKILNIRDDVWENHFKPLVGQTSISILPIVLHPKSRGTVRLQSKDFFDPPIINPNYLNETEDLRKLITGIRIIEKIIESPPMQKFGAEINPKPFPGCETHRFDSNDYWECYIRHMTQTMFHPVGTCKMGSYDDDSTVVLKNFQVKNIESLFVVDGSVLPNATSANPHAIIAMIAQKFVHDMVT